MDIKKLNLLLSQGICPDELNFGVESKQLDISKLKYNAFYRSYEFAEKKFPKGYESIPGMDIIIQGIADNLANTSPLEEMIEKGKLREDLPQNIS